MSLHVCFVTSLDNTDDATDGDEECIEVESNKNPDKILIDNLRSFSEYKIKVDAIYRTMDY